MRTTIENIALANTQPLTVAKNIQNDAVEIVIRSQKDLGGLLHWGILRPGGSQWQKPPRSSWPAGTRPSGDQAVQTPFSPSNGGGEIRIRLDQTEAVSSIPFVLYFPGKNRWDNNRGKNYEILIPQAQQETGMPFSEAHQKETMAGRVLYDRTYHVKQSGRLSVTASQEGAFHHLRWLTNLSVPVVLHWGISNDRRRRQWRLPPSELRPPGTTVYQEKAAQTAFTDKGTYQVLQMTIPQEDVAGIPFVLTDPVGGEWFDHNGHDFYLPLVAPSNHQEGLRDPVLSETAYTIIDRETGNHSWTLMHRFDLCHDLLDEVRDNPQGWALLFVWLRFSAIRQLDWQRNYNTKPRELAHAMDRLTGKLAQCYRAQRTSREWIRLIFTTLGRGGEGQRVRDEILQIMHRHHIKEVAGHFMEEWHQKLHNNTTPDDVVICEAYLAFLKHDGDLKRFYQTLEAGGVSKARLQGYDRPIVSDPDFIPHLKDALIHDFGVFLRILKGVHSGTDLDGAAEAAAPFLDRDLGGIVHTLRAHPHSQGPVTATAERIVEARRRLAAQMEAQDRNVREFLFLDAALEDFLRVLMEGRLQTLSDLRELTLLVTQVMEHILLSQEDEELSLCLKHWRYLSKGPFAEKTWPLEAKSVLDRASRVLGRSMDRYCRMLQPVAEFLGKAFQADPWSVTLFSEEVARGRPFFLLSVLIGKIEPILRQKAHLGDWQVVSPGTAEGVVKKLPSLKGVQDQPFDEQTLIVTPEVSGDEELPKGIRGVVTSGSVDIVSHVAIRARNGGVLLATCYSSDTLSDLEALAGKWVRLSTDASGEVTVEERVRKQETPGALDTREGKRLSLPRPRFGAWALASADFNRQCVGAKSCHLQGLQGKLPAWIRLPASVAIPFGVFEKVLADDVNRETAERYAAMTRRLPALPLNERPQALEAIRQAVMELKAPGALGQALVRLTREASLPWPPHWEGPWACIKRVWASKWNDRAYLSRETQGIDHHDLFMAVLIQEVVQADYAFVIHTVDPVSGSKDELFAEVVPGLGETLVGNHPGKAFGFSCGKHSGACQIRAFPSKGIGLFGKGLIFRSDSNGEDLSHYAGAGLYDSILLEPPQQVQLDYTATPLVTDSGFRAAFLSKIASLGWEVEQVLGAPQDIEGAYANGVFSVVQTRPQVGATMGA